MAADLEDEELFVDELPERAEETVEGTRNTEAPEHETLEDELEITIEGETPASVGADSDLVRKLRAEIKERDQRLKTYEAPKPIDVGEKPTLEGAGYDEAEFETQLLAWSQRKARADEQVKAAQRQTEENNRAWQAELQAFETKKAALGAKDFEAAEETVVSAMNQIQQAVIIKAAQDPAKVIYALGRHPERLKVLAAMQDPIKLAVAIAKLEGQITVNNRRAIEPEAKVRGSAPLSRGEDKVLAKLEAEFEKTGDRTAIMQYKRKLREQSGARK